MLSVVRLDQELMDVKREGKISSFVIGSLKGNELEATATMPDSLYNRSERMALRRRLNEALRDLGIRVDLTLNTDFTAEPTD